MASRKRSGSGTKRPKEKVVHIYEQLCRGEDPKLLSIQFWEEFFLLQPNMDMLECELLKLNPEQYSSAKQNILNLFTECIHTLSFGNSKRVHNALQTIAVFIHFLFRKQTGTGGNANDCHNGATMSLNNTQVPFITINDIEDDMRELLKQLYNILTSNISTDRPKVLCLKILLIIATGIDNVNENNLIEFIIGQNLFEAFKHILSDSSLRNLHGHDVVTLLTILVNYRKHEGSNPYVVELSLLADELALNGSIVMQDHKSELSSINLKLCLLILTCIAEDQYANSMMHDTNLTFKVSLHRAHMRHRKLTSEKVSKPQPLANTLLGE
uniref:Armadillo-like helical domain-containing protein n=1 Tax=Anopheles arabiensis TaxID=7173 RepID=A0A182HGK1_ANOAR